MQTRSSLRAAPAACAFILSLIVLLMAGLAGPASAQATGLTKVLCDASGCGPGGTGLTVVSPGAVVWYKITVTPTSTSSVTVAVKDPLPANFTYQNTVCTPAG